MGSKFRMIVALAGCVAMSSPAWAQSSRGPGWEYGVDAIYLDSADWSFDHGSSVSVDDDLALSLTFGYRFNSHLEVHFALDWQSADYVATLQSVSLPDAINVRGEYEAFTPQININYNLLDRNFTPYVTGGIGWSFIDTNIPSGQVEIGCWWDPWYGQICTSYQDTATVDTFAYQLGVGVRWDYSGSISLRFGYEKHWLDFSGASSTPEIDQLKLGIQFRY